MIQRMRLLNIEDDNSWLGKLKQLLQLEPQNKDQLIHLLRDAQMRELINSDTLAMIEGVIFFSQMKVRDIMLPKQQMTCIPEDASFEEAIGLVSESGHSRFPVLDAKRENVIGILHAKDLLRFNNTLPDAFDLLDIVRQASVIPESKRLDSLLNEFRQNRNHMAIVVDEYGVVSGFVTLEDILEQIIGDIEDEFDIDEEAYIKSHGNANYIIKAHTPINEFNEQLQADFSDTSYDTIGGIVMATFGYLPKRNESVTVEQFEFKILNADARRIKLLECIDKRANQTD